MKTIRGSIGKVNNMKVSKKVLKNISIMAVSSILLLNTIGGMNATADGTETNNTTQDTTFNLTNRVESINYTHGEIIEFYLLDDTGKGRKLSTTYGKTYREAIRDNSIILAELDRVDAGIDNVVIPNSITHLQKIHQMEKIVTTTIPYKTVKQEKLVDCETYTEKEVVVREGSEGTLDTEFRYTLVNGEEKIKNELGSKVSKEPVNKIVGKCKVPPAPEPDRTVVSRNKERIPVSNSSSNDSSSGSSSKGNSSSNGSSRKNYSGTKYDWMRAAGISESDFQYVDYIVNRESSWNPSAVNRSSGACGLVQALPCSKLGPNWQDPVVALKWQKKYVEQRYGGYAGAYNFWQRNHWY